MARHNQNNGNLVRKTWNHHLSWRRQRKAKKESPEDMMPNRLYEKINTYQRTKVCRNILSNEFITLRNKALVSLYYLTGCRISECLQIKQKIIQKCERDNTGKPIKIKKKKYNDNNEFVGTKDEYLIIPKLYNIPDDEQYKGLIWRDILVTEDRKFIEITTVNRKNKGRTRKTLVIPCEKEKKFVDLILQYFERFKEIYLTRYGEEVNDKAFVFPKSRRNSKGIIESLSHQNARVIINEVTGYNPHFLRHLRASHLIQVYDFNPQLLVKYMGWTDVTPAKHYLELSTKDIKREFYKND